MANYYDESVKIDENRLPDLLKEDIKKLKRLDDEEDDIQYIYALDDLESNAKSYVLANKIDINIFKKLMEKYGGII